MLPAGLVKSLVGHSQDMDTFGVYGHELEGDAQQQLNALNSIFSRLLAAGLNKGQSSGKIARAAGSADKSQREHRGAISFRLYEKTAGFVRKG